MPTFAWEIVLLGRFELSGPDGIVDIPSSKGKALIALLALGKGAALERSRLALSLWPTKERRKAQQNLRQLVRELNQKHDLVASDRTTCRLAFTDWGCDALDLLEAGEETHALLVPEINEPCLDSFRNELAAPTAGAGNLQHVLKGLLQIAQYTAETRPSDLLSLLHLYRDLLSELPSDRLEHYLDQALNCAPTDHPQRTWAALQHSIVSLWSGARGGVETHREALNLQALKDHPDEWTAAVFGYAVSLSLRGRFDRSQKLLERGIEILEQHGMTDKIEILRHGLAHRWAYEGKLDKAIRIIKGLTGGSAETMHMRSLHLTVYLLLAGRIDEGLKEYKRALKFEPPHMTSRHQTQVITARGYVHLVQGRVEEARADLMSLLEVAQDNGIMIIVIQCMEGLYLAHAQTPGGAEFLRTATRMRESLGYPLLPIDDIRLKAGQDLVQLYGL